MHEIAELPRLCAGHLCICRPALRQHRAGGYRVMAGTVQPARPAAVHRPDPDRHDTLTVATFACGGLAASGGGIAAGGFATRLALFDGANNPLQPAAGSAHTCGGAGPLQHPFTRGPPRAGKQQSIQPERLSTMTVLRPPQLAPPSPGPPHSPLARCWPWTPRWPLPQHRWHRAGQRLDWQPGQQQRLCAGGGHFGAWHGGVY